MPRNREQPLFVTRRKSKLVAAATKPKLLSKLADATEKSPVVRIWVRLNQSLTVFAFVVAAVGFWLAVVRYGEDQIKADEDRVAKAWDVIARMAGKQSNGGQVSAIERLNSMKVSLNNVDLHNTYLAGANLRDSKLQGADFSGATLVGVSFVNADLQGANFKNSVLIGADLTNANLDDVDFTSSKIINARVDLSVVLAKSLLNADLTNSLFVFEDEEGEKWESFSDTLAESRDDKEIQTILETACAHPAAPPKMNPLIGIPVRYKRCGHELDYYQISLKQPSANGVKQFVYQVNPFR